MALFLIFFFLLVLQTANYANIEILVILLWFAADSPVASENFPAPVLLRALLDVPLPRGQFFLLLNWGRECGFVSCFSPFFPAHVGSCCWFLTLIANCWYRKVCAEHRLLEDIPLLVIYESLTKNLESKHREHQVSISVLRW